jgi:hypothetical protein
LRKQNISNTLNLYAQTSTNFIFPPGFFCPQCFNFTIQLLQMKKILTLTFLFFITKCALAQTATVINGFVSKGAEIIMSELEDYNPILIHLDQQPIPAGEYGDLKQKIEAKRRAFEQSGMLSNTAPNKKTRGTAPNPVILNGRLGNSGSGVPLDNDIAFSDSGYVMAVVNGTITFFDDTLAKLSAKGIGSIFAPLVGNAWNSDPRVLYDPVAKRFILLCFTGTLSTNSTILIATSKTQNPLGAWNIYSLNGAPVPDSTWSDYPILAINDKELFITFNLVKDNVSWTVGFKQSVIWQIDKSDMYDGVGLNYKLWKDIKFNGVNLRNICPAKYHHKNLGKDMYFVSVKNVAESNDTLFLLKIADSLPATSASLDIKVLKTPVKYGFPPNARQKSAGANNYYLMTNDARILAAVNANERIHFGGNSINTTYMNAGVMLGEIQDINSATPIVKAEIISTATREYAYPSMAWMGTNVGDHKMLFNLSHCVTDSFSGATVVFKDNAGNWSDLVPIIEGITNVNVLADSVQRWGDYSNVQPDYRRLGVAYLSNSFGRSGGSAHWVARIGTDSSFATPITNHVAQKIAYEVFPNPATDRFTIRFNQPEKQEINFLLYDAMGQLKKQILIATVKPGNNEFSFSMQELTAGNYTLVLMNKQQEKIAIHKVIKL